MKEKKVTFKDKHVNNIVGVLHTPEGEGPFPAVVLIPGLASSKDRPRYINTAKHICKEKIMVLRIDPFGHGESDGVLKDVTITSGVESIAAAVGYLRSLKNIGKIGLLGSSYGGAASIYYSSSNSIGAVVLKSASSSFSEQWKSFLTKENINKWKNSGEILIGKHRHILRYTFYQDLIENYSKPWMLISKIKAPTLVIHGDKDESIPLQQAKKIYETLSGPKRMEILKGVGHIINDPKSLSLLNKWSVEWFNKYLK